VLSVIALRNNSNVFLDSLGSGFVDDFFISFQESIGLLAMNLTKNDYMPLACCLSVFD
jgi:hypothetical protein